MMPLLLLKTFSINMLKINLTMKVNGKTSTDTEKENSFTNLVLYMKVMLTWILDKEKVLILLLTKTYTMENGKTMILMDKVFSLSKIMIHTKDHSKMENITVMVNINTLTEKVIKVNGKKKNGMVKVSIMML